MSKKLECCYPMGTYIITYPKDEIKLIYPENYMRLLGAVKAKYTKEYAKLKDNSIYTWGGTLLNEIDKKETEAIRKKLSEITKGIEYKGEFIADRIIIDTFYCMAELSYIDVITNAKEAMEIAINI